MILCGPHCGVFFFQLCPCDGAWESGCSHWFSGLYRWDHVLWTEWHIWIWGCILRPAWFQLLWQMLDYVWRIYSPIAKLQREIQVCLFFSFPKSGTSSSPHCTRLLSHTLSLVHYLTFSLIFHSQLILKLIYKTPRWSQMGFRLAPTNFYMWNLLFVEKTIHASYTCQLSPECLPGACFCQIYLWNHLHFFFHRFLGHLLCFCRTWWGFLLVKYQVVSDPVTSPLHHSSLNWKWLLCFWSQVSESCRVDCTLIRWLEN